MRPARIPQPGPESEHYSEQHAMSARLAALEVRVEGIERAVRTIRTTATLGAAVGAGAAEILLRVIAQ